MFWRTSEIHCNPDHLVAFLVNALGISPSNPNFFHVFLSYSARVFTAVLLLLIFWTWQVSKFSLHIFSMVVHVLGAQWITKFLLVWLKLSQGTMTSKWVNFENITTILIISAFKTCVVVWVNSSLPPIEDLKPKNLLFSNSHYFDLTCYHLYPGFPEKVRIFSLFLLLLIHHPLPWGVLGHTQIYPEFTLGSVLGNFSWWDWGLSWGLIHERSVTYSLYYTSIPQIIVVCHTYSSLILS